MLRLRLAGGKLGPFGRPRVAGWRPGDPKRTWDLTNFTWYCGECEKQRAAKVKEEEERVREEEAKAALANGLPPPPPSPYTGCGACISLVECGWPSSSSWCASRCPRRSSVSWLGRRPTCCRPSPYIKTELTIPSRRLLKQYYELCTNPDRQQLALIAAMTERSLQDTQAWFDRRKYEEKKERERNNPNPQPSEPKAPAAANPRAVPMPGGHGLQQVHQRVKAQNSVKQGQPASGLLSSAQQQAAFLLGRVGQPGPPLTEEARAQVKLAFDNAKARGNTAYAAKAL